MGRLNNSIHITLGDPAGIGPEVGLKALDQLSNYNDHSFCVYTHPNVLTHPCLASIVSRLNQRKTVTFIPVASSMSLPSDQHHQINGAIAEACLTAAIEHQPTALVTAPLNKQNLSLNHSRYTGHTTLLQSLTASEAVSMAFWSPLLRIILTTIHIPLSTVSSSLSTDLLYQTATHACLFCEQLGIHTPKLALAGLNPHASEAGLFGHEESQILRPFLDQWHQRQSQTIAGPFSPDTVFYQASQGQFDMVIALYHDQGLIPIKLLAFDQAVNVTIGLPFIRTSPDHGTAFDIAYQDKADPSSMIQAIQLAIQLQCHTI